MNFITKEITKERNILFLIIVNAIVLFLLSFEKIAKNYPVLDFLDLFISFLFILEMIFKIKETSWREYISDDWNKMDFGINLLIIPSFLLFFIDVNILFLTILRLGRIFKFFKLFKFVPNIDHLFKGIKRAIKSSTFIVFAMVNYGFIISIISCFLYKDILPEYYGNPLDSLYSTFKVFMIEGWFDFPNMIEERSKDIMTIFFSRIYFSFILLTGGFLGLSFINAIFVDELVADNNEKMENEINKIKDSNQKLENELIEIKKINKKILKEIKTLKES